MKVVLFILSFQGDLKQPFLIITPSSALSLWEAEFSHWASCENIVVYQGNSDIRATIRTLEFYNEGGCIMFQVLLSPLEVVIEVLFHNLYFRPICTQEKGFRSLKKKGKKKEL